MIWVYVALAAFVGALLQRLSGIGVGLVCAPVLALLLGSAEGVLVTNAAAAASSFVIMLSVRRDIEWGRALRLSAACIPGAVAGALMVRALPGAYLQIFLGCVVLVGVVLTVALPQLPQVRGTGAMLAAGALGGLFNTAAGAAAPAMVVYSRLAHWEQRSFAATMQPTFLTMSLCSVAAKTLLSSKQTGIPPWWVAVLVVGAAVAAVLLGTAISRRVSQRWARNLALSLAGAGGVAALGFGIAGALG